jgi:dextranase
MYTRCILGYTLLLLSIVQTGCKKPEKETEIPAPVEVPNNNNTTNNDSWAFQTDKAAYAPGSTVKFSWNKSLPANAKVRYKYLGNPIDSINLTASTWTWTPPSGDYKGYLAELFEVSNGTENIIATIAIDVSSDWVKFPRYGFLSKFPLMDDEEMQAVIKKLNRYHINGIQFYDWQYKHNDPLAGTASSPQYSWQDIAGRETAFSTVQQYIQLAHDFNMKAMYYNLVYGAYFDAASDGVKEEWYVFWDKAGNNKDKHTLPKPPFLSDIYLLNPANTEWQAYMAEKNKEVYGALNFDGFHMDQLGNRNDPRYDKFGNPLKLDETFAPFIDAMKASDPKRYNVLNAVSQYGQKGIATSQVDFLYSEVWEPRINFTDLKNVIDTNNLFCGNTKNTVLAAYMNYKLAEKPGFFNTPSVLFADAVIFALGGAHLELGEHMLGKEYFPNDNLEMSDELINTLVSYYDFSVAYQNLLRDGGTEIKNPMLKSSDGKINLKLWPVASGAVTTIAKEIGNREVIHLLNFTNATNTTWRDVNGTQSAPTIIEKFQIEYTTGKTVKNVWYASPDFNKGGSVKLAFAQSASGVTFTVPSIKYWDMVVIEY